MDGMNIVARGVDIPDSMIAGYPGGADDGPYALPVVDIPDGLIGKRGIGVLESTRMKAQSVTGEEYPDTFWWNARAVSESVLPFTAKLRNIGRRREMAALDELSRFGMEDYEGLAERHKNRGYMIAPKEGSTGIPDIVKRNADLKRYGARTPSAAERAMDFVAERAGFRDDDFSLAEDYAKGDLAKKIDFLKGAALSEMGLRAGAREDADRVLAETRQGVLGAIGSGVVDNTGYTLEFAVGASLAGAAGLFGTAGGGLFGKGAGHFGRQVAKHVGRSAVGNIVPGSISAAERYYTLSSPDYEYSFAEDNPGRVYIGDGIYADLARDGDGRRLSAANTPDPKGRALYKAIVGGAIEVEVETETDLAVDIALGVLGAGAKKIPGAQALAKMGGRVVKSLGRTKAGQSLIDFNRTWRKYARVTGLNGMHTEMLEEHIQEFFDGAAGYGKKDSEYGGFREEAQHFWNDATSRERNREIFLGLVGTMALQGGFAAAQTRHRAGKSDSAYRGFLRDAGLPGETVDGLSHRERKFLFDVFSRPGMTSDIALRHLDKLGGRLKSATQEMLAIEGRDFLAARDGIESTFRLGDLTVDKASGYSYYSDGGSGISIAIAPDNTVINVMDRDGNVAQFGAVADAVDYAHKLSRSSQELELQRADKFTYLQGLMKRLAGKENYVVFNTMRDALAENPEIADDSGFDHGNPSWRLADGTVAFVLDNIPSPVYMMQSVLHESGVHSGLRNVFGTEEGVDGFLRAVMGIGEVKAEKKRLGRELTPREVEEVLAETYERRFDDPGGFSRIKGWMLGMLRKIAPSLSFTGTDVDLIMEAARNSVRGEGGSIRRVDAGTEEAQETAGTDERGKRTVDLPNPPKEWTESPEAPQTPETDADAAETEEPQKSQDTGGVGEIEEAASRRAGFPVKPGKRVLVTIGRSPREYQARVVQVLDPETVRVDIFGTQRAKSNNRAGYEDVDISQIRQLPAATALQARNERLAGLPEEERRVAREESRKFDDIVINAEVDATPLFIDMDTWYNAGLLGGRRGGIIRGAEIRAGRRAAMKAIGLDVNLAEDVVERAKAFPALQSFVERMMGSEGLPTDIQEAVYSHEAERQGQEGEQEDIEPAAQPDEPFALDGATQEEIDDEKKRLSDRKKISDGVSRQITDNGTADEMTHPQMDLGDANPDDLFGDTAVQRASPENHTEVAQRPAPAHQEVRSPIENLTADEKAELADLEAQMRKLRGRAGMGVDPEFLRIGVKMTSLYVKGGVRTFSQYAKAMKERLGDIWENIRADLRGLWEATAAEHPHIEEISRKDAQAVIDALDKTDGKAQTTGENDGVKRGREVSHGTGLGEDRGLDDAGGEPLGDIPPGRDAGVAGGRDAGGEGVRGGEGDAGADIQSGRPLQQDGYVGNRPGGQRADGTGKDVGEAAVQQGVHATEEAGVRVPQPEGRGADTRGRVSGAEGHPAGLESGEGKDAEGAGRASRIAEKAADRAKTAASKGHQAAAAQDNLVIDGEIERSLTGGTPLERIRANIEAIRLAKRIGSEGRPATLEEKKVLVKYVGWGGLADVFDYYYRYAKNSSDKSIRETKLGQKGYELYKEIESLLSEEELSRATASTLSAFYTPVSVVRMMHGALREMGVRHGRFLEPSAGTGHFIGAAGEYGGEVSWVAVEIDPVTGSILKALYPEATSFIDGYERVGLPDGFFDVAVGNVPFGDFRVDDPAYNSHKFSIHDYFFAKSLGKLRTGGVMAFITSTGTLDKDNKRLITYLEKNGGQIAGAVRLPNGVFKENAGTDVASDIIIIRKTGGTADNSAFMESALLDGAKYNSYFKDHPGMVAGVLSSSAGRYGKEIKVKGGKDTEERIRAALGEISAEVKYEAEEHKPAKPEQETKVVYDENGLREGNIDVIGGKLMVKEGEAMSPVEGKLPKGHVGIAEDAIRIRHALRNLIDGMLADVDDAGLRERQHRLEKAYDAFVVKHGYLNEGKNKSVILLDSADGVRVLSLEKWDEGKKTAGKADIFTKRVLRGTPSRAERADNALDALRISLSESGTVDMARMAELTGLPQEEVARQLAASQAVFKNPETGGYETAGQYLSGQVRRKLAAATAAAGIDGAFAANVKALEAVQPQDISLKDIFVRMGQGWIPAEDYAAFISEITGGHADVLYNPTDASWRIDFRRLRYGRGQYDAKALTADEIIERMMNSKPLTVYTKNIDGTRSLDTKATAEVTVAAKKIEEAFAKWISADEGRAARIEKLYNTTMNDNVPRSYDESLVELPGVSDMWKVRLDTPGREYQRRAIARGVFGGNLLLAHTVGAGKTFEVAGVAMELRRTGIARKPMITVPNHMIEQWGREFTQAYPNANVLAATAADFAKERRKALIAKIANGDWDAVVIGHSSFSRIGMGREYVQRYIEGQIKELEFAIWSAKADRSSRNNKRTVKDIENAKARLEDKLKKLLNESVKDKETPFEELGVDYLFVDEAHNFKGIQIATRQGNVPGIGGSTSQRAQDMEMKTRYVSDMHGGRRGVVFATGTPISNSMSEMYVMMRYLAPKELDRLGITSFDAWAKMFGEVVEGVEMKPTGKGFRTKARFARFINMPELTSVFRSFADVVSSGDLNVERPSLKTGKPIVHTVEPGEVQKQFIDSLEKRAANLTKGDNDKDNMLLITTQGRMAAIDPRLVGLPDASGRRIAVAAREVARIYEETADRNGTQLVFSDAGIPRKAQPKKTAAAMRPGVLADGADAVFTEGAEPAEDAGVEEGLRGSFDVYNTLKAHLVMMGVKPTEIAFIHDAETDAEKAALFARVRSGDVRVLIGSTGKMGEGTNVQAKLAALHHLDVPWKPAHVEQRNGRIIRPGNENKEVEIHHYVTKGTFDVYMWQTLERKARFIEQAMKGGAGARTIEDVDSPSLTYEEVKAMATGDPRIMRKITLEREIDLLRSTVGAEESMRRAAALELHFAQAALSSVTVETKVRRARIEGYREAAGKAGAFEVTLPDGTVSQDNAEIAKAFQPILATTFQDRRRRPLGDVFGTKLTAKADDAGVVEIESDAFGIVARVQAIVGYPSFDGASVSVMKGALTRSTSDKALAELDESVKAAERRLARAEQAVNDSDESKDAEVLERKLAELERLTKEIEASMNPKEGGQETDDGTRFRQPFPKKGPLGTARQNAGDENRQKAAEATAETIGSSLRDPKVKMIAAVADDRFESWLAGERGDVYGTIKYNLSDTLYWAEMLHRRLKGALPKAARDALDSGEDFISVKRKAVSLFAVEAAKMQDTFIRPMIQSLQCGGWTLEDLNAYAQAVHAPFFNGMIEMRRNDLPGKAMELFIRERMGGEIPPGGIDAEFIDALLESEGWAGKNLSDEQAGQTAEAFKDRPGFRFLEEAHNSLVKMNQRLLARRAEAGLMSGAEAKVLAKMSPFYVPLHIEMRDGGRQWHGNANGNSVGSREFRRAAGHFGMENADVIVQSVLQGYAAIERAIENEARLKLLGLLRLADRKDLYAITNKVPKKEAVIDTEGGAKQVVLVNDYDYGMNPGDASSRRVVVVKENGKRVYITFKGANAERIVHSIKGDERVKAGWISLLNRTVNPYLRGGLTTLNPFFLPRNVFGDFFDALVNLGGDGLYDVLRAMPTKLPSAWRAIKHYEDTGAFADTKAGRYLQEAIGSGMSMEQKYSRGEEEVRDALLKQLGGMSGKGEANRLMKGFNAAARFVRKWNQVGELGTRFATYMAARESGMPVKDATELARNVTVDFHRKGRYTSGINALYLFSNASIQGAYRMGESLLGTPHGRKALAAIVLLSFIARMLSRAFGWDDGYGDVEEWVKQGGFVFKVPFTKGKWARARMRDIPAFLWYVGVKTADCVNGDDNFLNSGAETLKMFADSVINPLGEAGSMVQTLSPTVARPFVQQSENKNWTGRPIVPGSPYDRHKPQSERYYRSTPQPYKRAASGLNRLTGGDSRNSGAIDISPEIIKHWVDFIGVGIGRELQLFAQETYGWVTEGTPPSLNHIPFARSFAMDTDAPEIQDRRYYEAAGRFDAARHQYKTAATPEARRRAIASHPFLRKKESVERLMVRIRGLREKEDGAKNTRMKAMYAAKRHRLQNRVAELMN